MVQQLSIGIRSLKTLTTGPLRPSMRHIKLKGVSPLLQSIQDVVLGIMEDYPRTLLELEKRFSSEEACQNYLEALLQQQAVSVEPMTCGRLVKHKQQPKPNTSTCSANWS